MNKTYIYSYNQNSKSARLIANGLDIPVIRHQHSKFRPRFDKTIINWGSSRLPDYVRGTQVVNNPDQVHQCSNKLLFFEAMSAQGGGPRVVEWTDDPEDVLEWLENKRVVIARTTLSGHSGEGIVFLNDDNVGEYLDAPLFTIYKPKKDEYRVHIMDGNVIDVQKKLLRKEDDHGMPIDPEQVDFRIRNLGSGFVYGRNDIHPDKDVLDQAVSAFRRSGLVFGAVDVIWNQKEGRAYVLEINSAPGLEGTTVENYISAFQKYFETRGVQTERTEAPRPQAF